MAKRKKTCGEVASTSVAALETIQRRIAGCSGLFSSAKDEIAEKIARILDKQDGLHRRPDHTEHDTWSRVLLPGSAKMERAAQDLEAVADGINGLAKDIRALAAESN